MHFSKQLHATDRKEQAGTSLSFFTLEIIISDSTGEILTGSVMIGQ